MNIETERKFLVKDTSWKEGAEGVAYRQGYLSSHPERTVRVRTAGEKAYLTIKGKPVGASRSEFEYEIPHAEAERLLDQLCEKPLIEKIRYKILYAEMLWEVDEFSGDNTGLVVAEVELASEDQPVELPPWAGAEVTEDQRYYNSSLVGNPFSLWGK